MYCATTLITTVIFCVRTSFCVILLYSEYALLLDPFINEALGSHWRHTWFVKSLCSNISGVEKTRSVLVFFFNKKGKSASFQRHALKWVKRERAKCFSYQLLCTILGFFFTLCSDRLHKVFKLSYIHICSWIYSLLKI